MNCKALGKAAATYLPLLVNIAEGPRRVLVIQIIRSIRLPDLLAPAARVVWESSNHHPPLAGPAAACNAAGWGTWACKAAARVMMSRTSTQSGWPERHHQERPYARYPSLHAQAEFSPAAGRKALQGTPSGPLLPLGGLRVRQRSKNSVDPIET